MRLVVVGPITRDITVLVDAIPPDGGSAIAREQRVAPGGKGANPSVAAAALGAEVSLIGAVGRDEPGAAALTDLRALGIDVSAIECVDAPTGCIIHLAEPEGHRRYVEVVGANGALGSVAEAVAARCTDTATLLVSTAVPRATAESAVAAGARAGARVVLDAAGPAETTAAVLSHAYAIRGDAQEIARLVDLPVEDFETAERAARELLARGPRLAVVQAAGDGDVVVTHDEDLRLARLDTPVVDPTGAGDAMIATLAVLFGDGRPLAEAARLGSAAAAHTAAHLGGRPSFRGEDELVALLS